MVTKVRTLFAVQISILRNCCMLLNFTCLWILVAIQKIGKGSLNWDFAALSTNFRSHCHASIYSKARMTACLSRMTGVTTVVTPICLVAGSLRFLNCTMAIRMPPKIHPISRRGRVLASNIVTSVYFIVAVSLLILVYIKVRHNHSKYRGNKFTLRESLIRFNLLTG
jgi:hypothetical protein